MNEEKMFEDVNFDEFTPIEIGEAQVELDDLMNETKELIKKCELALGGDSNE